MYNKRYQMLAMLNFILGICAICLYLPYTIQAFSIKGFKWLNFAKDILKDKYLDVCIYFGIFLLAGFIILNLFSLFSHTNFSKIAFKISIISALVLPLVDILSIKYNWMLDFWIKSIAPNIKMISYILLCVAVGSFVLGLILNFTRKTRANVHIIVQALIMCCVIVLFIAVRGWCGWDISNIDKLFGILMSVFAIYLPISVILLIICVKNRV